MSKEEDFSIDNAIQCRQRLNEAIRRQEIVVAQCNCSALSQVAYENLHNEEKFLKILKEIRG